VRPAAGRGGPARFPAATVVRSAPRTPGSLSRLRLQALPLPGRHPAFRGLGSPPLAPPPTPCCDAQRPVEVISVLSGHTMIRNRVNFPALSAG
jgi:hypothetical protein